MAPDIVDKKAMGFPMAFFWKLDRLSEAKTKRRIYYETGKDILNENDMDFPMNFAKEDRSSALKYKYLKITK